MNQKKVVTSFLAELLLQNNLRKLTEKGHHLLLITVATQKETEPPHTVPHFLSNNYSTASNSLMKNDRMSIFDVIFI